MYRPLPFFIGLRYTRAKRRNHFISVISMISMACFALGVMALIAVLSVMNGFDEVIRERVFSMAHQVTVTTYNNALPDWQSLDKKLDQLPLVTGSAPYVIGQGMLTSFGQASAALVFGVDPAREQSVSKLGEKMVTGSLDALQPGAYGIALGQDLATNLGLSIGDKVMLITPVATVSPIGIMPRSKRFTVQGIFNLGTGFGFDNSYAYINLTDAQKLYQLGDDVSGVRLKLADLYQAPQLAHQLQAELPPFYIVKDWTQQYGVYFEAIALEKTMMFFILLLIIVVAAFSLISTLYMVVSEKQADIAILRTMGATPRTVLGIFIVQGSVIGVIGTLLGLILGVLLSLNLTELFNIVQSYFHTGFLSSNVYYVNYLPSKLEFSDVIKICSVALIVSLIATILPAWRAARIQPVEALRYE